MIKTVKPIIDFKELEELEQLKKVKPYKNFIFAPVPDCVMRYTGLSAIAKLCLGRLFQYAGKNKDWCCVSHKTLSLELGLSPKSGRIKKVLRELEKEKFLLRQKIDGHRNIYWFLRHEIYEGNLRQEKAEEGGTIVPEKELGGGTIVPPIKELGTRDQVPSNRILDLEIEEERKLNKKRFLRRNRNVRTKKTSIHMCDFEKFFETFWKTYPSRRGKKLGKKQTQEYLKKNIQHTQYKQILSAVQNYAESKQAKDGYARDPIRFVRNNYWQDWLEAEKTQFQSMVDQAYNQLLAEGKIPVSEDTQIDTERLEGGISKKR